MRVGVDPPYITRLLRKILLIHVPIYIYILYYDGRTTKCYSFHPIPAFDMMDADRVVQWMNSFYVLDKTLAEQKVWMKRCNYYAFHTITFQIGRESTGRQIKVNWKKEGF